MWAPGGEDLILPPETGYLMGQDGYKSFILNIHYDNPLGIPNKVDRSGVRVYYVSKLRPFDAGVMQIADPLVSLVRSSATLGGGSGTAGKFEFTCPSTCVRDEVTVFSEFFHMHAVGARMTNEHIRNNEVIRENHVDYYDFDISGGFGVNQAPYTIEPGDSFRTTCYYQSNKNVVFGDASDDEMCIAYFMYYPAAEGFNGYCALPESVPLVPGCEASFKSKLIKEEDMGRRFGKSCLDDDDDTVSNPIDDDVTSPGNSFRLSVISLLISSSICCLLSGLF